MSTPEAVEIFRTEAQELFERLELALLDLEGRPDDSDLVATVFRAMHTLKGSGAMYGFDALSKFAHHFETAFDRVRKGEAKITPPLIAASLRAIDTLRALAEDPEANCTECDALLVELDAAVRGKAPTGEWRLFIRFAADALRNGTRPLPLFDELRELGEAAIVADTDTLPPLEELNPAECHLAWRVTLATGASRSDIEDVFVFTADDMTLDIAEAAAAPKAEAETAPAQAEPPPPAPQTIGEVKKIVKSKFGETLRIPAERLDDLMNRIGELVIAQARLKQVTLYSKDPSLRAAAEEIERLSSDLRDSMMTVRMVPIAQLFGRFRRLIQDIARDTGKKIAFITNGETTELDKSVIERLADPLIHLIRNSADHGLEPPDMRIETGKPETGRLTLSAHQTGTEVVITIEDDGRGIDRARVRAKAEENGLLQPGANLSDRELLQMIFQPGFSTAKEVTNLSGRGVGMDVVKRTIESLRGTIDIASTSGVGSRISLRIPLTLAIIDGLLIRVGNARYVIPLATVEECVELPEDRDAGSSRCCLLTLRDCLVPFIHLSDFFGNDEAHDPYRKVVVVSAGQERIGLVVDQIFGGHQTVIKPLSPFHAGIKAFSGATILGDGSVALIIDAAQLIAISKAEEACYAAG